MTVKMKRLAVQGRRKRVAADVAKRLRETGRPKILAQFMCTEDVVVDNWGRGEPPHKSNNSITTEMITKNALESLKRNLQFANYVGPAYDKNFAGVQRIGATVNIRKPPRFKP